MSPMTNNNTTKAEAGEVPSWLKEVFRRNGPCPTCGTLGMTGKLEDAAPIVNPDLKAALGKIVSTCADRRDIFPDTETALSVIADELNELYARLEGTIDDTQAIERAGARMMHGDVGRRLTSIFADDEIRSLAGAALSTLPVQQSGRASIPIPHCPVCQLRHTPTCKETLQVDSMERVEAVARILCARDGHDPDALVDAGDPLGNPTLYPGWMLFMPDARKILSALPEQFAENAKNSDGMREEKWPKLTPAMIEAAAEAHYGKLLARASGGADGIDMTVNSRNWSFADAMRRMWPAMKRAALSDGEKG